MASPVRQYTNEIHDALGYWATWLPGAQIRLGDCGPVSGRVLSPEASLKMYGINFQVVKDPDTADLQYVSRGGVSYQVQLAGQNQTIQSIPSGKAGIEIDFLRQNGIVFVAKKAREHRIADIDALGRVLAEKILRGDFPAEYAVVTHLVMAEAATILIASAAGATFAVSAKADLKAGLLDLANAKADLSRVSSRDLQTEIVAANGLKPLFKLVGFKKGGIFRGSPRIEKLGFEDDDEPGDFSELSPGDTDPEE